MGHCTATEAEGAIRRGELTSEAYTAACLARIAAIEGTVGAWAFLDPERALDEARAADAARGAGKPLGPLHGLPVGVKDIIDTADMPTENGTPLHAGRRPTEDAAVVASLRRAGAVILGKTVTTELAVYSPGKTRNPRNPGHSPGGSSSGSAAAVAAGMAPLAVGSQTNGSVIRPAAYCGVVGYKPTYGCISRHGMLRQSPPLDQVGLFADTLEDAALLAEPLMAFDPRDPAMRPGGRRELLEALRQDLPTRPRLGFVRSPYWEQAAPDAQSALAALAGRLGGAVEEVQLPPPFSEAASIHRTIMEADFAVSFAAEYARGADRLSPMLRTMIEGGQKTTAADYRQALSRSAGLKANLDALLAPFDGWITPATTGEAPAGLASTGSPIFCTTWTLCGVPAVTVPLLTGATGLPIGVQVVGRAGQDSRLLRVARWLEETLGRPDCPLAV
ncbi:MAG: amidase [candidate division NC10 bacterium]|nr:amidase [candidate division NC10 bacterium]